MENFLENLILIKLKKYFKTLNFNKVMLVFLGNNKLFYDNFSFSVLKLISWQKIKPRLNLFLCYAKNGIYGKNYLKLEKQLNNFDGMVIFIDSGICLKEDELGLVKISNKKLLSVASLNEKQNNQQKYISIVLNTLCASGALLNEKAKMKMAKMVYGLLFKLLSYKQKPKIC